MTKIEAILEDCRLMRADYEGNNAWPAIRMDAVTALCDEVERLQSQREAMLFALKTAQWCAYNDPDHGLVKFCPNCRRDKRQRHCPGCIIADALSTDCTARR